MGVRHRHEDPVFSLEIPDGAQIGPDTPALLTLVAPDAETPLLFRPNLTITGERLAERLDPAEYVERSLADEAATLPGWYLIDREDTELSGRPALRTLATYLASAVPGSDLRYELSVAVEQWRLLDEAVGWIVTVSSAATDFDAVADGWRVCVESFRVGDE